MKTKLLAISTAIALSACQSNTQQTAAPVQNGKAPNGMPPKTQLVQHPVPTDLDFSKLTGTQKSFELNGKTIQYRAYENIVYALKPTDTRYQTINIYIPEAYFNQQSIDGFNAQTAPIFFPNNVGGYMPATAGTPELDQRSGGKANAMMVALSKGYVVASAGARGRIESTGRAPAAIIDLKAAVRYLKANDKHMAGNANKIISNGTSAGGALSALLGASGNAPEFEPYLREIGAAKASDNIYAVSAYCPITNLDHADSAYEWQFNGVNDYQKIDISMLDYRVERKLVKGTQTAEQIALSNQLKPLFPSYVNGLKLKDSTGKALTLDKNGNGTFKQYIERLLQQSAQTALNNGTDLSQQTWLKTDGKRVTSVNFDEYAKFVGRQKTAPAFDGVDLSTGENNLFGDQTVDKKHFTDFGAQHSTAQNAQRADKNIVHMMNAMNYTSNTASAKYYRIRHGENDRDTSIAIPALLALKLQQNGKQVDFAAPWGQGHGGDYDLEALFAWAKQVANQK